MKVALAAERSVASQFDSVASFWCEFINEEQPEKYNDNILEKGKNKSEKIPSIIKPTIIY